MALAGSFGYELDLNQLSEEEKTTIESKMENKDYDSVIDLLKKNAGETEVDEDIKNGIGNLTLLDSETNRSYGNSLFCTKRRIIIDRIKQGVFVPVATQYIFSKFYDEKGTNRSVWAKEDMEAYQKSGILTLGGTILGTSRQPFKLMRVPDKDGIDKVEAMKHTYHKLNLDCLVILGGNGTHKSANMLREEGLNVVTLPKTIDNDLWGTDMTFGFQSAVDIATDTIDRIHTTATSHSRVFIVEVMGHKVGWVTLHAGIAGGADIILLPEMP